MGIDIDINNIDKLYEELTMVGLLKEGEISEEFNGWPVIGFTHEELLGQSLNNITVKGFH